MQRNRHLIFGITAEGIVLIPLNAMQFTSEVNWNITDIIVAAALLFGMRTVLELTLRTIDKKSHRIAAGIPLISTVGMI